MNQKLLAAIIGTGHIAGGYDMARYSHEKGIYSHAGALRAGKHFKLETVFDTDYRIASSFANTWRATAVKSISQILDRYHDIVFVCTPDKTHFAIVKALLLGRSCKIICVEKPAAETSRQYQELIRLATKNQIPVVTNFQRHFDKAHIKLAQLLQRSPANILCVQGLYMKGLFHNGVTMVDTLRLLLGNPHSVLAIRRVLNRQVLDYSYDFVLFYRTFAVTVRTADSSRWLYNYHVFEIDILLKDRRISIVDNSRTWRESHISHFGYSGVKVLNEKKPILISTGYSTSMINAADYLYRVTTGRQPHLQNTLESSYANQVIIEAVKKSYDAGLRKMPLPSLG